MSRATLAMSIFLAMTLSCSAHAEALQIDIEMIPTYLGHPGVFGFLSLPSCTFEAHFFFDTNDDTNPDPNVITIPDPHFTFQGDWSPAEGAWWDETMAWPTGFPASINVDIANLRFTSNQYWSNDLNNQFQIGLFEGVGFRMIDASAGTNNLLYGTMTLTISPAHSVAEDRMTWGEIKARFR